MQCVHEVSGWQIKQVQCPTHAAALLPRHGGLGPLAGTNIRQVSLL